MIIYKTTNLVNEKIYIGQDSNNNPTYYGSGKILLKAIKKYGKHNFKKEILEECDSTEILNRREIYWISQLNSTDKSVGYNISDGSNEGDREIGKNIFKIGVYEYWVETFGVEEADKRLETKKRKISEYQQYKLKSGWEHSDEAKKSIGESSKNRRHTKESKIKMCKPKPEGFGTHLHIKVSQFTKGGEFVKTWDSIVEAEKTLNIKNIGRVLSGKRKTCGGFIWKYEK